MEKNKCCSKGMMMIRNFKKEMYGSRRNELRSVYADCTEYTREFNGFIRDLIEKNKSTPYNEYFRIDVTGWNSKKVKNGSTPIYDWNLDYAIEYENQKNWTYEIEKLSFVHADVRIVIGYMSDRKVEVETIAEQVQYFKYPVAIDEEFYIIILNRQLGDDNDPFGMQVYKLIGKSVELVSRTEYW